MSTAVAMATLLVSCLNLNSIAYAETPYLKGKLITDTEIYEFVDYYVPNEVATTYSLSRATTLPSSVDLSTSPCFPPIGDQQYLGACNSFATAYYQFSYEVNKLNNVTSTADRVIYSPKWVFNLVNCGMKNGSILANNFNVLKTIGCLKNEDFTYTGNADDYNSIPASMKSEKIEALKTRISAVNQIEVSSEAQITSATDSKLNAVKTALNNGKVLVASSLFNWNSYYNGSESIAFRCTDNSSGEHTFAIVGYNDNKSYDVNKNGVIENCEKGAFKIANSWGTSFDGFGIKSNTGYFWVMYDALNAVSANTTNNWESAYSGTRVPAFNCNETYADTSTENDFYYIDVQHYDVNYVGELLLDLSNRYDTEFKIAKSTSSSYTWSSSNKSLSPFDGNYAIFGGGDLSFNGYFYFDYSSLATPISNYLTGYKWFLYSDLSSTDDIVKFRMIDNLIKPITAYTTLSNAQKGSLYRSISLIKGDLDYSGAITSSDVTILNNYLASLSEISNLQKCLADINNDGVVNVRDVSALNGLI